MLLHSSSSLNNRFGNLFPIGGISICGRSYFSNGCHVTVNAWNDCKINVPGHCLLPRDIGYISTCGSKRAETWFGCDAALRPDEEGYGVAKLKTLDV